MKKGDRYGLHRVLEPKGVLPQPAWRIDNTMECWSNEILINVETLNIDSASFRQIKEEANGEPEAIGRIMKRIVNERGKHHNPVTGSGGMLIGTVAEIGEDLQQRIDLQPGDRIATLVSLSLTPLFIEEIQHIDQQSGQVDIRGKATLFESGLYAKVPEDLPLKVTLAVLDVCGAPAQTKKLVETGQTVVVLGASGKSGLLVLKQARDNLDAGGDRTGRLIAIDRGEEACSQLREFGWADVVLDVDASDPIAVFDAVREVTEGKLSDLTINCVNIPGTEMSSILATRDEGIIYFFSMATSFTAAALGAEGVGKDVTMLIGNGYTKGHAELALQLVRDNPELRAIYSERYGK
ncbi:L-erythro-3,5-diaminohexanoate dehydrogenase [Effusibacillus consociatus]|uniref:L-erythro-3,5-diaminohexanoate dehydrogenase n=1 Tax=Effusibacillus consociatus TaxID=1117041 RepID=A0ABV9PZH4_9BACL